MCPFIEASECRDVGVSCQLVNQCPCVCLVLVWEFVRLLVSVFACWRLQKPKNVEVFLAPASSVAIAPSLLKLGTSLIFQILSPTCNYQLPIDDNDLEIIATSGGWRVGNYRRVVIHFGIARGHYRYQSSEMQCN